MTSQRARRSDSQDRGRCKRATDPSPAPSTSGSASAAGPKSAGGVATPTAPATKSDTCGRGWGGQKKGAGLGPDDCWHRDMCHNFLTQYRKYLMSEFGFICINLHSVDKSR